MAPSEFRITGDQTSGNVIVICKACGEQFDGKYSETTSWRRWHLMNCSGKPAETG